MCNSSKALLPRKIGESANQLIRFVYINERICMHTDVAKSCHNCSKWIKGTLPQFSKSWLKVHTEAWSCAFPYLESTQKVGKPPALSRGECLQEPNSGQTCNLTAPPTACPWSRWARVVFASLIALMMCITTNLKSHEFGVPAGENLLPDIWAKSIPVGTSGKIPWMKHHF